MPGSPRLSPRATLTVVAGLAVGLTGLEAHAQIQPLEPVVSLHESRLLHRVEQDVHRALLAASGDARDAHLDAAEQVARHLVGTEPGSAEAQYWLAVTLGVRTEYGGPLEKLTTGKEVFFTAARVLELDPDHPGGHEMMGRLHVAVMRLPWLIRGMAMHMGLGEALGEASWTRAEEHFRRACALDGRAVAPRLELAKLYLARDRAGEARPLLKEIASIDPGHEVDRRMVAEGRDLLHRLDETLSGG
mgnify:CR=1 FL=1